MALREKEARTRASRTRGRSGASRGRDQVPEMRGPRPHSGRPLPTHAAPAPVGEACFFSRWSWPPHPAPTELRALGAHVCLSETRQPLTLGQTGSQRAEKVGGGGQVGIVPACRQPRSPTGSRRRVADVRADKGRHGPHQPPVIGGLCQPRWSASFCNLRTPPPSGPCPSTHPSLRPAEGSAAGRGTGGGEGFCFIVI